MLIVALLSLASLSTAQDAQPDTPPSDEALEAALRANPKPNRLDGDATLDHTLLALAGRDTARWTPILQELLDTHRAGGGDLDLYYLTALRRMQGREDPLKVEARLLSEGPYLYPELPIVGVRLVHTEGETESFSLTLGGEYRSGRLGRWDVWLTDEFGAPHAGIDDWTSLMGGGGIYRRQIVGPGFAWGIEVPSEWEVISAQLEGREVGPVRVEPVPLAISNYKRPLAPGKYEATLVYHDHAAIADERHPERLFVFRSEPLRFEWQRRPVRLEPEREARIRVLAIELLEESPVLVTGFHLTTGYDGDAKGEHALDRLFAEGWAVLPVLVDMVEASRDPVHRAWWLAALYDLSGLESPAGFSARGALGSHHTIGNPAPAGAGVVSSAPTGKTTSSPPTLEAQERFVVAWRQHLEHFAIDRN
jgi:hypothetical protein